MLKEGDIVEIPLRDGRTAYGWILHVSRYFSGTMGFVVLKVCRDSKPGDLKTLCMNLKEVPPPGLLYTGTKAAKYYKWQAISSCAVKDDDMLLTKRLVGGDVYVGDIRVGAASALELATLKPMMVSGMIAFYTKIESIYPVSK